MEGGYLSNTEILWNEKLLLHTNFYWNRTIGCCVIAIKPIFLNGAHPPSWISKIFIFRHPAVIKLLFCTKFHRNRVIFVEICDFTIFNVRVSVILNVRSPIMGSLKSPWTSCRSSTETIALNCLLFLRKSRFMYAFCDRRTNGRTKRWTASKRKGASRCRERRLNNL